MLPEKLSQGSSYPGASWFNRLLDHIQTLTPRSGSGINVSQTPYGVTISTTGGSSVSPGGSTPAKSQRQACICTIMNVIGTTQSTTMYYTGYLYASDGKTSMGEGKIQVSDMAMGSTLSVGERYVVHPIVVDISGGSEPA